MKRILIAFVALTLAACLLTGCGKKDDDSDTATTDTAIQAARKAAAPLGHRAAQEVQAAHRAAVPLRWKSQRLASMSFR